MTALTTAKTPFRRTFSSLGALAFLTLTAAAGSAQASLTLSPQSLVVTPIPPIVLVDPNDVVSSSTIAAPNCSTNPPGKYTCLSNVWQKYCASYWNANDPTNPNNCAAQNQANLTSLGSTLDTQQAQGTVAGGKVFDKAINDFTPTWPTQNATLLVTGKPEDTVNSWAAHESKAKLDAAAAYISDPKTYVRYFPVGNGVAMDHCDKYVYRSFWDIERWIDATNACKNDARCIAQVSMYGMTATGPAYSPGIARKPLMDSDGMAITDRVNARPGKLGLKVTEIDPFTGDYALYGMMPKNNYYLAEQLISPVLIAGFAASGQDAKVQALANEVHRGATLYDLSAPASTGPTGYQGKTYTDPKGQVHEAFYDEWDFHNVMEQRTRQVTDGEAREYRRRNDALVASWNRLADELKCVTLGSILQVNNGCGPNVPNALGKVNPGDIQEWDGDPLAARLIISQVDPAAWMMPPSVNGMVGYGSALQVSNVTMNQIMAGGVTMGLQALGDT
ncbi:MAG: hypothetical protein JST92_17205 [Deltaproteobacteria bacterium]|nr:hypothetical protein [Deltaproteobacteria bacterium]